MGAAGWEELLAGFPRASKELLERRNFERRADSKFVLPVSCAADLVAGLMGDYAVAVAGSSLVATYRTLYFDTEHLDLFQAHARGRRVRHKVRIRHYPDRLLSFLEVKTRVSELETVKSRRPRRYDDSELVADDVAFVRARTGMDRPLPQVWTDFRRVTLVGVETRERVTVDLDVCARLGEHVEPFRQVAIVEVKQFPLNRRTPIMIALRDARFRPAWASKYCAAIAFLHPDVNAKRLLPDLRGLKGKAA